MQQRSKKTAEKFKRSDSAEPEQIKSKRPKLTKTSIGVIGSFSTESTIYYQPYFMFVAGRDPLFKIRDDYTIPKVIYKPFLCKTAPELFEYYHDQVFLQYDMQTPHKKEEEEQKFQLPKGFQKTLKKSKIQVLFDSGVTDLHQLSKDYNLRYTLVKQLFLDYQQGKSLITRSKKPKKLREEHLNFIKEFFVVPSNVTSTLNDIREGLMKHFDFEGQPLSTRTVSKAVREAGFTRKKITNITERHNSEETKLKRKKVALEMIGVYYQKRSVVYIDESAFHIGMQQLYGYSQKGAKAVSITQPKSINYSLLAAIRNEGIIAFQIFRGSVKSADFNGFMARLISNLGLDEQQQEIVFFMDNASIHKNLDLREEIWTQITIIYNAPYSPQLNPIEECFSLWKHHVRKSRPQTERELVEAVLSAAHSISSADCRQFVRHSLGYYRDCFQLNDIE